MKKERKTRQCDGKTQSKKGILARREIPEKTKTEVVRKIVKLILTYDSESWSTTERQKSKLNATEIEFLRKIKGNTKRD